MPEQPLPIHDIRSISRRLVRELGFMGGDFAGTDLPPSAVHALIEIEACPGITARDLAKLLRLEKSSVSRMLRKLVLSGDLLEETDIDDSRIKRLRLTKPGHNRVGTIHAFANRQVSSALTRIGPAQALTVLEGLRLYADALRWETGAMSRLPPSRSSKATGRGSSLALRRCMRFITPGHPASASLSNPL